MSVDLTEGGPPATPDPAPRVTRRRLLAAVGTLGAAGIVTAAGLAGLGGSTSSLLPPALSANLTRLPGVEHLRAIGEAVEGAGVLDRSVGELTELIAPAGVADPVQWCTRSEPEALRDHVAASAAEEFVDGRVLEVDGWRLARSEAALAMLVARN